ncbi:MAG: DUF1566 domain-containing protein [Nannocystaceae bacterium]|nr:DUF1566 domain-containing protein [Nannocystaceae bacterium]
MTEVRRDGFTIVLAHGSGESDAAAAAAAELRSLGHPVTTVAIADADAPLMEACAKLGGRGLFVVARGPAMTGDRAEALRELLRDLGVPMSRSLSLPLSPGGAREFAQRVTTLVRRIATVSELPRAVALPRPPAPPERAGASKERSVPPAPAEASGGAAGYAVVPPSFDADAPPQGAGTPAGPASTPMPTTPPIAATTTLLDATVPAPIGRRRLALVAASLAMAVSAASWLLVRDDDTPAPAPEPTGTVADGAPATVQHAALTPATAPPLTPPTAPIAASPVVVPSGVIAAATTTLPDAEDAPTIVAALRKREIRALDVFVVAPESRKPDDFRGAAAYCDKLEVAGISGWRLPEIGELISMSRAKMLRKGSYWSVTKGDTFGDLRLVLVVKRERISPVPAGWDAGRILCVRERS